jgi:hypothetical protein
MKKNKELTFLGVNLGGLSKKIYNLLKVNPTTKYVIQKTGKSKFHVSKIIKQLIEKGYIERVSPGLFRVNLFSDKDYLRLHNLDIQLRINYDIHKQLYNLILKKQTFKNIRSSGRNKGYYFDIEGSHIIYMITSNNIFAKFPKDWEVIGKDVTELMSKVYDIIRSELLVLQNRYKVFCFKDGRVNFNIRNMHIALVKNGIAEEFHKRNVNNLVIYDNEDKKPRYIFDMSKGNFELEAVHPKKAFDDADEAHYFMDKLKDGGVREVIDKSETFFDEDNIKLSDLKNTLLEVLKTIDLLSKENKETAVGVNMITNILKNQLSMTNGSDKKPETKPDYIL